ncbi:MAG: hypothetical protein Q9167_002657 [Letrouitia subvulpina]
MANRKPKSYGKSSVQNIAIAFERLNISTREKGNLNAMRLMDKLLNRCFVLVATRQPLKPLSENVAALCPVPTATTASVEKTVKAQEEPSKTPRSTKKRLSLRPEGELSANTVSVDETTAKYLQPLLGLTDVNPGIKDFASWAKLWSAYCNISKIAQGSYGAVFRLALRGDEGKYTIGKIIPLRPRAGFGSRTSDYASISDASNEVSMLIRLNDIPGYVEFRSAEVLHGLLPEQLFLASKPFDDASEEESKNWDLATKNSEQMWLFLEMSDAGTDLEQVINRGLPNEPALQQSDVTVSALTIREVRDIFWSVAKALAVAEKRANFEHRDLHLGNICIQKLGDKPNDSGSVLVPVTTNLVVTIIDYTLSRATLKDQTTLCNHLSKDPALFRGQGDVQYDIYRYMKRMVTNDKHKNKSPWTAFVPLTNVAWLYHLLLKLLDKLAPHQELEDQELSRLLQAVREEIDIKKYKTWSITSARDVVRYLRCSREAIGDHKVLDDSDGENTEISSRT